DTPTPIQTAAVEQLVRKSVFIVPVVTSLTDYQAKVPKALHPGNGMEISGPVDLPRVASHLLEGLHLLRRRRRLFISYRRSEAKNSALQLYHELDSKAFDVFLDT